MIDNRVNLSQLENNKHNTHDSSLSSNFYRDKQYKFSNGLVITEENIDHKDNFNFFSLTQNDFKAQNKLNFSRLDHKF